MKHLLSRFFLLLGLCLLTSAAEAQSTREARAVIERFSGRSLPLNLSLSLHKLDGCDVFETSVRNGRLTIKGSSNVALCRGFYDYVKSQGAGICSWSGNRLVWPVHPVDAATKRVVSSFANHYYFNVVTYGYSMPYWDWTRWEREIDWMALHGIDMPLALVGYEAIIARVWKKMGLSDDEINNYFVAPAHLPWMRMGNISGVDAPLNADWHRQQIALQHRILRRMRQLGMKPICMGFPGFVPEAFKRIHPEVKLLQTHWGGAFCNWMISPQDPLFAQIGSAFIKEWEREFGPNSYYLVDSFNEMDVPFPPKGTQQRRDLVAAYGEKVYRSIHDANPHAVWAMQGWMFGYQRDIWDYETLGALVSRVPDDKMLLLDLAVDYNRHFWHSEVNWEFYKGFYNKPWVYSVIPNMGGKTGMTGVLDFYANGHRAALTSPNRGRLAGHGMAPEGIENNEVIYELMADAGWTADSIDVRRWLAQYSRNRYGGYNELLQQYWEGMLQSVYGSFTDHPRYNWQFRPGTKTVGSIRFNDAFFKGVEAFIKAGDTFGSQPLYQADVAELAALYLGGKAEWLTRAIDRQYEQGDTVRATEWEGVFGRLLSGMDRLLCAHPTLRLDRWLGFARQCADTEAQRLQYERNARRIVTVWGPPVDDYSARVWSGLLRDYYLPRWNRYFAARKAGTDAGLPTWELQWVGTDGLSPAQPPRGGVLAEARALLAEAAFITPRLFPQPQAGALGRWKVEAGATVQLRYALSAADLSRVKGIRLVKRGGAAVVRSVAIEADGRRVAGMDKTRLWTARQSALQLPIAVEDGVRANNGAQLLIELSATEAAALQGEVSLLL